MESLFQSIEARLQAAGYRTGLFGKYLNGYPNSVPNTYVPPGWDDWASAVYGSPAANASALRHLAASESSALRWVILPSGLPASR